MRPIVVLLFLIVILSCEYVVLPLDVTDEQVE
jgi:hypothetical protein